jgi:hypothetical protein
MRALLQALARPRQIILTHAQSSLPVRHVNIRPLTLILLLCMLLAGSFFAGSFFAASRPSRSQNQTQPAAPEQKKQEQARIKNALVKSEALLSMREQQIESMQQDMKKNQQLISSMHESMKMFETILAARKIPGVHLLQASAHWQADQSIAYRFVLVKGENYPRLVTGSVQFSVRTPENKVLYLNDKDGEKSLQYSMKTHVFLQGDIAWAKDWRPERLKITLFNQQGKQLEQGETAIEKP